jgi:hydroxyethylthiazole kinase-like sugar kinase family protein
MATGHGHAYLHRIMAAGCGITSSISDATAVPLGHSAAVVNGNVMASDASELPDSASSLQLISR